MTIEHSDYLNSPSHMLSFLRARGWSLPSAGMIPNLMMPLYGPPLVAPPDTEKLIDMLLFWGWLEQRKGMLLFVEALKRMSYHWSSSNAKIVFMGLSTIISVDGSSRTAVSGCKHRQSSIGQHGVSM